MLVGSGAVAYTPIVLTPAHSIAENVLSGTLRMPSCSETAKTVSGAELVAPSTIRDGDRNAVIHGIAPSANTISDTGT